MQKTDRPYWANISITEKSIPPKKTHRFVAVLGDAKLALPKRRKRRWAAGPRRRFYLAVKLLNRAWHRQPWKSEMLLLGFSTLKFDVSHFQKFHPPEP